MLALKEVTVIRHSASWMRICINSANYFDILLILCPVSVLSTSHYLQIFYRPIIRVWCPNSDVTCFPSKSAMSSSCFRNMISARFMSSRISARFMSSTCNNDRFFASIFFWICQWDLRWYMPKYTFFGYCNARYKCIWWTCMVSALEMIHYIQYGWLSWQLTLIIIILQR